MTTRVRTPSGPHRRTLLAWSAGLVPALAAASAAGCADTRPGGERRAADRDPALRAGAADDSRALLARYAATVSVHPPLAGRLAAPRAQTALHVAAFDGPSGSPGPSRSPSGPPRTGGPGATAVPADAGTALRELAERELSLAAARVAALGDASPDLAALLASVAACGAGHALLLQGGA